MGINAHTDTFKFTAPIFPNTVYTWNHEEKVVSWQDAVVTDEEVLEAFIAVGMPQELFDQFKQDVHGSKNLENSNTTQKTFKITLITVRGSL